MPMFCHPAGSSAETARCRIPVPALCRSPCQCACLDVVLCCIVCCCLNTTQMISMSSCCSYPQFFPKLRRLFLVPFFCFLPWNGHLADISVNFGRLLDLIFVHVLLLFRLCVLPRSLISSGRQLFVFLNVEARIEKISYVQTRLSS